MQSRLGTGHLKRVGSHHLCQLLYLFFWLENNILPKVLEGVLPVFKALSHSTRKAPININMSDRPHACISPAPTGRISMTLGFLDSYETMSIESKFL
jgi:hypothetical protein